MTLFRFLKCLFIISSTFLYGFSSGNNDSTGYPGYMVLVPTGVTFHKYPVLKPLEKSDPRYRVCKEAFEKTFLNQMVRIHKMVQQYLLTKGKISRIEPAYLLLSGRSGGYPMNGFFLRQGKDLIDKSNTGYVDLKDIEKDYAQPGSFTQIFPHELAHIYYKLLTGFNPDSTPSYSSDIHYFSIVTDYYKAFNEGFAESFENISRNYETDNHVRQGIDAGIIRMSKSLPRKADGYDRDFRWPLRIGFYRMSMLFWYQQFEDYKRFAWSRDNLAGLMPVKLNSCNPEKDIVYRNSCVIPDPEIHRNIAQAAATEGEVCAFFTRLMTSGMIESQVMKELVIIDKYFSGIQTGESPLHVFIRGYCTEFPGEKDRVLHIYRLVTAHSFTNNAPPELWILNKHFHHSFLIMAPYGGAEIPYYTFNMNTAGPEDFRTFKNISRKDALKLVQYRDSKGSFQSFNDLKAIHGLDPGAINVLLANRLVPDVLRSMDDGGGLKISNIFYGLLHHFLLVSLIILVLSGGIIWLIFYYRKRSLRKILFMVVRSYAKVLLFMVAALASIVLVNEPLRVFIPFLVLLIIINLLRTRNIKYRRPELLGSTMLIGFIIIYSLI